jgi:ABC-2 type transport system permease protein
MSQTLAPARETARPPASLRRVFAAAVRSEWIKLRTVRSTIWSLVATVILTIGLGALFTAIEVSRWDHLTLTEIKSFDPLFYSLAGLNLAGLSVGVLGVLVMTSEYSTRTIKLTLGATPQRSVLLAAKVATFSAVVAVVGIASCFAAFWLCQALLAPKHAGLSIADPGVLRAVIGGAAHLVFIGILAVALGAAIRRTAGAVAVLFAVILVIPGLASLLPSPWDTDIIRYLPNSAGEALSAVARSPDFLSPAEGLIVACAYTAAALTLAALVLNRRDA